MIIKSKNQNNMRTAKSHNCSNIGMLPHENDSKEKYLNVKYRVGIKRCQNPIRLIFQKLFFGMKRF